MFSSRPACFLSTGISRPPPPAVAATGRGARLRPSRNMNADFRRLAAFHLVPFGGRCDQLAVIVAPGDVGHQCCRQRGGFADRLAALFDGAFVGELAQNSLQLGAVGVLQAELARDLAGADVPRMRADEGDDGVPGRKAELAVFRHAIPPYPLALPALFFAGVLAAS